MIRMLSDREGAFNSDSPGADMIVPECLTLL